MHGSEVQMGLYNQSLSNLQIAYVNSVCRIAFQATVMFFQWHLVCCCMVQKLGWDCADNLFPVTLHTEYGLSSRTASVASVLFPSKLSEKMHWLLSVHMV